MGREVRRVRADWVHPQEERYGRTQYVPLFEGPYSEHVTEWDEAAAKWEDGFRENWVGWKLDGEERWVPREEDETGTYEEWAGERPKAEDYMPEWTEEEKTHIMMYENTTEGTPISPAFPADQPEALARWLADNNASAFGYEGASYEDWLRMITGAGFAPTMIIRDGVLTSGVEGM